MPANVQKDIRGRQFPMQPLVRDERDRVRFKENRIVRDLLDFASTRGLSLNEIARRDYTDDERMQLAELIGYSIGGYGELSYVSNASYKEAERRGENI